MTTLPTSRLLVVDDDPAIVVVIERFAAPLGFEVIGRTSGLGALASLADVKPDVALVDLQMPDLGGIDVLRAMRAAAPDCQVILMTGNATATPVTIDNTTQHLYADFLDIPTAMIVRNDLLVEIGDPSHEGYLKQILATFRFSR